MSKLFKQYISDFNLLLLSMGVTLSIVSVLILGISLLPNLRNKSPKSLIYFKDISSMKKSDFKEKIKKFTHEEYDNSLIEQIYILSKISTEKHNQIYQSIIMFIMGLFLFLILILKISIPFIISQYVGI